MQHSAHYSDGRTAVSQEVRVQAGRTALHLYGADGEHLDEWPYAGLYAPDEVYDDGPVRLRHKRRGDAALTLADAALLGQIEAVGGPRLRGRNWMRPTLGLAAAAAVLVAALLGVALWWGPALLAPLVRWVPPAWEQALGERVVTGMAGAHPECAAAEGRAALGALTARLAGQVELPYPLRVHVLADGRVNAFALPGGHLLVLQGLLDASEAPEELAGVLAHEIAHAAERHPMQNLVRVAGSSLLVQALTGSHAGLDATAARFAQVLVLTSYSREAELEADRVAMAILNRADIAGAPLADFLGRIAAGGGGEALPALSTHPVTSERIGLIRREATGSGAALTTTQWLALRAICEQTGSKPLQ